MLVEMRKWILAAIAVSVVFLGGCMPNDPTPQPTVTVTAPAPTPTPVVNSDYEFIFDVSANYPQWTALGTEAELIELGKTNCRLLDQGVGVDEILTVYSNNIEFGMVVIAAAIVNYCPQHDPNVY